MVVNGTSSEMEKKSSALVESISSQRVWHTKRRLPVTFIQRIFYDAVVFAKSLKKVIWRIADLGSVLILEFCCFNVGQVAGDFYSQFIAWKLHS